VKKYLITDPIHYTTDPEQFFKALNRSLIKYNPDFICFRDKTDGDKHTLIRYFLECAKNSSAKTVLNGSVRLASEFGFYGVHLPSSRFCQIKAAKESGLTVVASAHSEDEALEAFRLGSDFITLSPLFASPNKGVPLGCERFLEILKSIDRGKVFALGGIDDEQKAKSVCELGVFGFASIRYFVR